LIDRRSDNEFSVSRAAGIRIAARRRQNNGLDQSGVVVLHVADALTDPASKSCPRKEALAPPFDDALDRALLFDEGSVLADSPTKRDDAVKIALPFR
jgi:hypothetical protein